MYAASGAIFSQVPASQLHAPLTSARPEPPVIHMPANFIFQGCSGAGWFLSDEELALSTAVALFQQLC